MTRGRSAESLQITHGHDLPQGDHADELQVCRRVAALMEGRVLNIDLAPVPIVMNVADPKLDPRSTPPTLLWDAKAVDAGQPNETKPVRCLDMLVVRMGLLSRQRREALNNHTACR